MAKKDHFQVEGDKITRARRSCPKCGDGVFLARHADREACGRCGYTEFKKKVEKKRVDKAKKPPAPEVEKADTGAPSLMEE